MRWFDWVILKRKNHEQLLKRNRELREANEAAYSLQMEMELEVSKLRKHNKQLTQELNDVRRDLEQTKAANAEIRQD